MEKTETGNGAKPDDQVNPDMSGKSRNPEIKEEENRTNPDINVNPENRVNPVPVDLCLRVDPDCGRISDPDCVRIPVIVRRSPSPVTLDPFIHQVGGHFPMVCMDQDTVCKPLNDREHRFYGSLPRSLRPFAPCFEGTMRVETCEDEDGYIILRGQPPPGYASASSGPCCLPQSPASGTSFSNTGGGGGHYRLKRNESIDIERVEVVEVDSGFRDADRKSSSGSNVGSESDKTFFNPWALKCHRDHLKKLGLLRPSNANTSEGASSSAEEGAEMTKKKSKRTNPQLYLLLENLVSRYEYPCVLDLKVGARQYADEASAAKKQRKLVKAANSTLATLGLRLCGMQVYNIKESKYTCRNKYFGRALDEEGFKSSILEFFQNGTNQVRQDVIDRIVAKLEDLLKVLHTLDSFRFYTSSLLVTYDGSPKSSTANLKDLDISFPSESSRPCLVDVRIIDFAHSTHKGLKDSVLHVGPDEGFIFGVNSFIEILNDISEGKIGAK